MKKLQPSHHILPLRGPLGFTLIEILVYVAVLAILVSAVSSYFLWMSHSNIKIRAMREVLDNARRTMEIMTYEIKEAKSIYTPTSSFDSHPGQLSLEIKKYLPEGETTSYIDFYLCGNQLCLKKESQNPITLTSDRVEVNNLVFSQVVTSNVFSIQIDLEVDYKAPADRPEYRASIDLTSTASIRSY